MEQIRGLVGYNLKRIRLEKKLTQKEVSDYCKFEIPSYSRWENGKSWPSPETIQSLAEYFSVSPTDFYKPIDGFKPSITDALKVIEDEAGIKIEILARSKRFKQY